MWPLIPAPVRANSSQKKFPLPGVGCSTIAHTDKFKNKISSSDTMSWIINPIVPKSVTIWSIDNPPTLREAGKMNPFDKL